MALLSHTEVVYQNWDIYVAERRLFYLDGIISFMRMFPETGITFLKEEGYISQALAAVKSDTPWHAQANLKWSEDVAANQLRRIKAGAPVAFTKVAHTIVACELALAKTGIAPRFWVYDHMRIIPAVYNIDRLNDTIVEQIKQRPNAKTHLQSIAGSDYTEVLNEMVQGYCVTSETAHKLEDFIRLDPSIEVGSVRFRPGKKRLGKLHATAFEQVPLR
jgi:hypothetical protein